MPVPEFIFSEIALLFWNVRKLDVKDNIVRLVQSHNINILVVAEVDVKWDSTAWLSALNAPPRLAGETEFSLLLPTDAPAKLSAMSRLHIFTRLPPTAWQLCAIHNRYAVWRVSLPGRRPFTLATVHMIAHQQDQGDKQRECAIALRQDIEKAEGEIQVMEAQGPDCNALPFSIVIGDFNANPFDAGIAAVYGLNATHLKEIAMQGSRRANGRLHPYFYNPMWRFLGVEPWGTYFNNNLSNPIRFDWFLLDQVLVRPDVLRFFDLRDKPDVQILTSDGIVDFNLSQTKTKRDDSVYPDHLPLYFRCDVPEKAVEAPLPE